MKQTAVAPSNIAFVKYWGRKNEQLRLPTNGSISMNLSGLTTTTSVEFDSSLKDDEVTINNVKEEGVSKEKVSKHLDRIRGLAGIIDKARVVSENSFPRGTGLSSSASGFAALTLAATKASGLDVSEKELSILARQGSGSACRSIPDGFVEWFDGDTSESSYAKSIFPADYWDIVDIVCVLTTDVKDVSTSDGQQGAATSPLFKTRQEIMKDKLFKTKRFIQEKDFHAFGELVEHEALEMHAIMMTQYPSLLYWNPATLMMMKTVMNLRDKGLPVYFTINTGQNIHLICEGENAEKVVGEIEKLGLVKQIIYNTPAEGARIIE